MKHRNYVQRPTAANTRSVTALNALPIDRSFSLFLLETQQAGFQYDARRLFSPLHNNPRLSLLCDAQKHYDENFIVVEREVRRLGFIPGQDNGILSQIKDRGEAFHARVRQLKQSLNPWERVEMRGLIEMCLRNQL